MSAIPRIPGFVKRRIKGKEVPAVQMILDIAQGFAKPLEMYHFPLPEETDRVAYLRILHQTEDVVIGGACLLLCCIFAGTNASAKNSNGFPPVFPLSPAHGFRQKQM